MSFEIRKISDVGARHPVVARLGLQTSEFLNWLGLDQSKRDAISTLYVMTLKDRLLHCHEIRDGLAQKS